MPGRTGVPDGLAAAVFGAGICLLQYELGKTKLNTVASNLLVSLLTGLAIGIAGLFTAVVAPLLLTALS